MGLENTVLCKVIHPFCLIFFNYFQFYRLLQSVFLLPRYLERDHERITKTFEKRGLLDNETTECIENQNQERATVGQTEDQSKKTD